MVCLTLMCYLYHTDGYLNTQLSEVLTYVPQLSTEHDIPFPFKLIWEVGVQHRIFKPISFQELSLLYFKLTLIFLNDELSPLCYG